MDDFKDSPTALVADVDCTAGGEALCSKHGVEGYPTLKWGDPNALEKYEGGRTYDDLKNFADENLGPSCSPGNLDLCDGEKKAMIEKFMKMSKERIDGKIKKAEKDIAKLEKDFEEYVKGLQDKYSTEEKKKGAAETEIKESGLAMMKQVLAHLQAQKDGKAEL